MGLRERYEVSASILQSWLCGIFFNFRHIPQFPQPCKTQSSIVIFQQTITLNDVAVDNAQSPVIIFVPGRHRRSQDLVVHPQVVGPACLEYFNALQVCEHLNVIMMGVIMMTGTMIIVTIMIIIMCVHLTVMMMDVIMIMAAPDGMK